MPLHFAHSRKKPSDHPFQRPQSPTLADIAARVPRPDLRPQNAPAALCDHGKVTVYLAGSEALAAIARRLGLYTLKVGMTVGNPHERIRQLNDVQYAGLWGRSGDLKALPGASSWQQFRLSHVPKRPREFVAVTPFGDIQLRVPISIERSLVDAAINAILEPRSLRAFLRSDDGLIRCHQAQVDADAGFWTAYPGRAPAQAREIFVIDPRRDGTILLDALDALGEHLARER